MVVDCLKVTDTIAFVSIVSKQSCVNKNQNNFDLERKLGGVESDKRKKITHNV